MFQAIEIDGEPYWDGGFAGNPTITPLVRESDAQDSILVQINPLERPGTPRTASEILKSGHLSLPSARSAIGQNRTSFMITEKFFSGSAMRLICRSGLPSSNWVDPLSSHRGFLSRLLGSLIAGLWFLCRVLLVAWATLMPLSATQAV